MAGIACSQTLLFGTGGKPALPWFSAAAQSPRCALLSRLEQSPVALGQPTTILGLRG